MEAVTTLPRGRPLIVADLESMPDDGHRYELIDGALVVTPAPSLRHQTVSGELFVLLHSACPPGLRVLAAPFQVSLSEDTGVPSYWVVDPAAPRLVAWELQEGAYTLVADVAGDESWTARTPYPVTIVPEQLGG